MYKVIKYFTDLHDNDYPYSVGDTFPRAGLEVSAGRIAELLGNDNRQGVPLIVADDAPKRGRKPRKAAEKG